MTKIDEAWIAHQRQRWLRPNAHLWMKPSVAGDVDVSGRDVAGVGLPAGKGEVRASEAAEIGEALDLLHRDQAALRAMFEALKRDWRASKANFNPNQPRVPAGNPDGGQWTHEGSSRARSASEGSVGSSSYGATKGHHFVPKGIYQRYDFPPETFRIFDESMTGRLHDRHGWSRDHDRYNEAVREHLERYLQTRGLRPEQASPDHAREFVDEVKRSRDPRIREFNRKIFMREVLYWMRRGPRTE